VSGEERVLQVMIFGETYALRSADPAEYVHRVGQYVDGKFYEIAKGSPNLPAAKMGILASLNIADELFRKEEGHRAAAAAAAAKVAELVELLEAGLAGRRPESRVAAGGSGVAGNGMP
jgi:cell division protein ZapA (FtsZ GTPase activity inhibitor)